MAAVIDAPQDRAAAPDRPLTAEEVAELEHVFLGPTWRRKDTGGWDLPEHTLGWQIAGWCTEYLNSEQTDEDGNPLPWNFTNEQLRFLLWWYAVDESGRFVYRKGVLQRLKGWGKDPLLAVICLVEFVGPSRFSHWGDDGQPVAVPHAQAWVQVAASSKDQTRNTMAMLPILMSDRLIATYGIKPGEEMIRANGGKQHLEAVTSNPRALEGRRSTFVVLNETHHWVIANKGHGMYETIDGNTTKKDSRYLAITNAYLPGEDSIAERMRKAWQDTQDGLAPDVGFLYDSIEANPRTPLTAEALRIVIPIIRGDAIWLRVETIIQSIADRSIPTNRSRRMWLNQVVADKDSLISEARWDALLHPQHLQVTLLPGQEIVLGFDGGHTDDDTALVAIRISDGCVFVLGHWHKPADFPTGDGAPKWEIDRAKVDSAVHETFRTYKVRAFFADVYPWDSYIIDWTEAYGDGLAVKSVQGKPIAWDMRSSLQMVTLAHERLLGAIRDLKLCHVGDLALRRHALNAQRRENKFGVSFGKESRESTRKVDLYAALMIAHEALIAYRTRRSKETESTGESWFM